MGQEREYLRFAERNGLKTRSRCAAIGHGIDREAPPSVRSLFKNILSYSTPKKIA